MEFTPKDCSRRAGKRDGTAKTTKSPNKLARPHLTLSLGETHAECWGDRLTEGPARHSLGAAAKEG